ncbi:hypothetical protein ABFA25_12955 [Mycobacterium lepromatosis]
MLSNHPAVVQFIKHDTPSLGAERYAIELGSMLMATPEQTIIDLARRP